MRMRARILICSALLVAAAAACDDTTSTPKPTGVPPIASGSAVDGPAPLSPLPEPTDCQARIEQATFDDLATIERVAECRFTKDGVDGAAAVLTAGAKRDSLWSALWVYDTTSAAPVMRYVTDPDPSIRAMAAAIVARLGERSALLVLGELATDPEVLLGSHPPAAIGQYAMRSLARLIVATDLPPVDVERTALGPAATAWQGWLAGHAAVLTYDADAAEWRS